MLYSLLALLAQQPVPPPAPAPDHTNTLIAGILGGITTILGAWLAYRQGKKQK